MEQFDLSYRALDDWHYFIPSLLPYESPEGYEKIWERRKETKEVRMIYQLNNNNNLLTEITTSFIAHSHRYTTNTHWRYGAIFIDDDSDSLALVQAFPDEQRLDLSVRGTFPYEFFTILHNKLKYTFQRFPGLTVVYKKPCLGHEGQPCQHEFDYVDIQIAEKKGEVTLQCPKKLEAVSLNQLIYGIEDKIKIQKTPCPTHFQLKRHQPKIWQKPFIRSMIELHLCCESPDGKHPTPEKGYYFPEMHKWINSIPLIVLLANLYLGSIGIIPSNKLLKTQLKFMSELLTKFPDETKIHQVAGQDVISFHKLLETLEPFQRWGLEQVPAQEELWLCEKHTKG
jgi:hypothetical protein